MRQTFSHVYLFLMCAAYIHADNLLADHVTFSIKLKKPIYKIGEINYFPKSIERPMYFMDVLYNKTN